jgi:hypothetical protein
MSMGFDTVTLSVTWAVALWPIIIDKSRRCTLEP